MTDATFEDGAFSDQPLRLGAETTDDLGVVSALTQDAVGLAGEISWMPRRRRAIFLLNRFRWEDKEAAAREGRAFERVRCALLVDDVLRLKSQGLAANDPDTVYSVLSIAFEPTEDGAGTLHLTLAGDGVLALDVECINLQLVDLTRPWQAAGAPDHGAD